MGQTAPRQLQDRYYEDDDDDSCSELMVDDTDVSDFLEKQNSSRGQRPSRHSHRSQKKNFRNALRHFETLEEKLLSTAEEADIVKAASTKKNTKPTTIFRPSKKKLRKTIVSVPDGGDETNDLTETTVSSSVELPTTVDDTVASLDLVGSFDEASRKAEKNVVASQTSPRSNLSETQKLQNDIEEVSTSSDLGNSGKRTRLLARSRSAPEFRQLDQSEDLLVRSMSDPSLCEESVNDPYYGEEFDFYNCTSYEEYANYYFESGYKYLAEQSGSDLTSAKTSTAAFEESYEHSRIRRNDRATQNDDPYGESEEVSRAVGSESNYGGVDSSMELGLHSCSRILTPIVEGDSSPSCTEDESTTAAFLRQTDETVSVIEIISDDDSSDMESPPSDPTTAQRIGDENKPMGATNCHEGSIMESQQSFEIGGTPSNPETETFKIQNPDFGAKKSTDQSSHFQKFSRVDRVTMHSFHTQQRDDNWFYEGDELRLGTPSTLGTSFSEQYEDSSSALEGSLDGSEPKAMVKSRILAEQFECKDTTRTDHGVVIVPTTVFGTPVQRKSGSVVSSHSGNSVGSFCSEKRKERDAKAQEFRSSLQNMQHFLREGHRRFINEANNDDRERKMLFLVFATCLVCFFGIINLAPLFAKGKANEEEQLDPDLEFRLQVIDQLYGL